MKKLVRIRVSVKTKRELARLMPPGGSYDDVVNGLLALWAAPKP